MKEEINQRVLTAPNILSLLRILMVPVFLVFILGGKASAALFIFCVAGVTDFLDGFIARSTDQKSKLGQFLDPAGDKLLMSASFITLSLRPLGYANVIPAWLTAAVFGRDIYIVVCSLILFRMIGQKKIYVSILGKLTTICQMGVLMLVLLFNWLGVPAPFLTWFYLLTLLLTALSGIHYTVIGFRMLDESRRG